MKAPPAGALSVKTVGAVTSRVIVSPCTEFELRSVTVVWFAPGEVVFVFVHV